MNEQTSAAIKDNPPAAVRRTLRRRAEYWLRRRDHRRLADLVTSRHRWWDWGHRLMALVGQDFGGSWSEPSPPTWYYRVGTGKRMWRTGFPIHPVSTFEVIKTYDEFRAITGGMDKDHIIDAGWKAMSASQDGELHLGWQYWGHGFYGLTDWECRLLAKYLRHWRRLDWYGARSWLYKLGLNAAVDQRRPFTCQATPPKDSGGYSHWHCDQKRRHDGPHRFRNYVWWETGGRVQHVPTDRETVA